MQTVPSPYDLQEELENWHPSAKSIFLARTAHGPLYVPVNMLWHVALTGPTGGGKTNILRGILMQLVSDYVRAHCYLCDIHYAPIKTLSNGETVDWRPIADRLALPPLRDVNEIYDLVEWVARQELKARIDRQFRGEPIGKPLTLAIEELPAVIDERPDIASHMVKIWRQGRQYGICFIGATQDMLVKTLGTGSGPRECLRTGFYTGGDAKTAKVILDLQNGQKIDEDGLGINGLVYVKTAIHLATQARVPLASNDACYSLLGVPQSLRNVPRNTGSLPNSSTVPDLSRNAQERLAETPQDGLPIVFRNVPGGTMNGNATLTQATSEEREQIIELRLAGTPRRDICRGMGKGNWFYDVVKQVLNEEGII